ncbi:hypothetical protein P154DRAFT_619923 [Amniculicola lignicola CBS 123094]|uniref:Uncharacterized protein n=1 Tax=Amniculicola lignicola CBS 123094 TaxID=1392246 RepID=A0A6A5WIP7_9PLEO|nr:hypothetical protein P154DRAFT_619923 [Amniculicola lignicola CBS 123094]
MSTPNASGTLATAYPSPPSVSDEEQVEHICCPACRATLASVSRITGCVSSPPGRSSPCIVCSPFDGLRAEMQSAEAEFDRLRDRRKEHTGRREALHNVTTAKRNYTNFLLELESIYGGTRNVEGNSGPSSTESAVEGMSADARVERAHSLSPTPSTRPEHYLDPGAGWVESDPQGKKRARSASPTLTSPPSLKRQRLVKKVKRVSFGPDVVFPPVNELRVHQEFQRGHDEYVHGRFSNWGLTTYLDTSGFAQKFKDFYRQRWDGKRWVELSRSDEESEENEQEIEEAVAKGERGGGSDPNAKLQDGELLFGASRDYIQEDIADIGEEVSDFRQTDEVGGSKVIVETSIDDMAAVAGCKEDG